MINGSPWSFIVPKKGLRQRDPLSHFMYDEALSGLISKAKVEGKTHDVMIARQAPKISHILFVDDSIIFHYVIIQEAIEIQKILKLYEDASGQLINFDKSTVPFSSNIGESRRRELCYLLGLQGVVKHKKYLGLPTMQERPKKETFGMLSERVWKKLKGRNKTYYQRRGKKVLLKSMVQAIPAYIMSVLRLSKGLCNDLQTLIARFWWRHEY
ncbi:uncharacterized protein LOC125370284 [Ricinus communis]|uniref:uncharacterized protein LOC125370284 n=1 Tax=Ricinus communis TaxID=3988 RepID=UPI00201AF833|nr:uncharacterized protein LOC125370284 [Ricinus communis]